MSRPKPKAAVQVLGCKVNQTEAEAIADLFRDRGYEIVDFSSKADVYIIHTCTVTRESDRKSRQIIRRAVKRNPEAIVAVTGCYAQTSSNEIAKMKGVDLIIGTSQRNQIVELVEEVRDTGETNSVVEDIKKLTAFEEFPLSKSSGRTRAFLKVQEGCRQFCTYCIIPYARGPVRSRPLEKAKERAEKLISMGYKEIVLTGIRLGAYGVDLKPPSSLAELVGELSRLDGLLRLRISSIDPNDFSKELVDALAGEEIVCPHYHISLQSGDNSILRKMGRRYTSEEYLELVSRIRSLRPESSFTTDVMVGFPGEKEIHFHNTKNFLNTVGFMDLHVFKYSPRAGTPAADYPEQIPGDIKKSRSKILRRLSKDLYNEFASCFLNETMEVLAEQRKNGLWEGHTPNYIKVKFPSHKANLQGETVPIRLMEMGDKFVMGREKMTDS